MDINEKALLFRAFEGDRGAAGTLYEIYYRDLYSYIYYRVSDDTVAEALSAEVFVRMIRLMPGHFDQEKPFISWLYTLAKKIILDYDQNPENFTSTRQLGGNGSNGKDHNHRDQEALGCFQRALTHLSESHKEVIIHRFVEGRSVQDIADLMNQSEKAIQNLQFKALKSLEEALAKENCL